MKRLEKCLIEDCIPTLSSCIKWNGGDISFLGICDGDSLNYLMQEIISEIQKVAGKDLSKFNITSLLAICKKEAPEEVNLISILTLLRDNQLCLKVFIDELDKQLQKLFEGQNIKINLKCYTGISGLGLGITREQLDQFVINILCEHENALDSIDDTIKRLQEEINEKRRNTKIEEVQVSTCVNSLSLPLSEQVQNTSKELCDYLLVVGNPSDIADALALTPTDLNPEFGTITGWINAPVLWSEYYSNSLLEIQNLRERLTVIENTCCAVTCDDIIIKFTAYFNEDKTGVILKFTKGAGMVLPKGFEDCGSIGTITDQGGNVQEFDLAITMGSTIEVPFDGLVGIGSLSVNISAKICNNDKGIECHKCKSVTIEQGPCDFCVLTASGNVTVTYRVCSGITILQ